MSSETTGSPAGTKRRKRYGHPLRSLLSIACVPIAPVLGTVLAYVVYHPRRRGHHRSPTDFGLDAQECWIQQPSGAARLHCWVVAGRPERVVVMGHGVGLSKSASLAHARLLHEAGYTVVLFDHRNHGRSGSDPRCHAMSERFTDDVESVVAYVRARPEWSGAKITVYGFSFSTFPVLHALTREGHHVDAVVCDSGPTFAVSPLFTNFLRAGGLPLPRPFRSGLASRLVQRAFVGAGTAMLRPRWPPPSSERLTSVPMLFLVGARDRIVEPADVERLACLYPRARVVHLPGAAHLNGLKKAPEAYTGAIHQFLDDAFGAWP